MSEPKDRNNCDKFSERDCLRNDKKCSDMQNSPTTQKIEIIWINKSYMRSPSCHEVILLKIYFNKES